MWITYLNWFLALLSITIWVGAYIVWGREKLQPWFDNKFGKDDPMPPIPKQKESNLHTEGGLNLNYGKEEAPNKPKD